MPHRNADLAQILRGLDLGSSVAEFDHVLEVARVETSVFTDLLLDRVDLIPGTKGSGKSALFRMVVDFLAQHLLKQRRIVIAHGVTRQGDPVFKAFEEQFKELSEDAFVDFWCIYLTSLAREDFTKDERFTEALKPARGEVAAFHSACVAAGIPEFKKRMSLRDILGWVLSVLKRRRPQLKYHIPSDTIQLDLLADNGTHSKTEHEKEGAPALPQYIARIKGTLEELLRKADLQLWLMIDRLDEVFLRRSDVETRALRGLLRTLKMFQSEELRVKVFLRDDILEQVTEGEAGFTALTHVMARKADTLKWSEDQVLRLIVKRIFANGRIRAYLDVDAEQLEASSEYRMEAFYKVFPRQVHSGDRQTNTLRWIYSRTTDGRGVVTPRDVIDLVTKAKQWQSDQHEANSGEESDTVISSAAIIHGLRELSVHKRDTLLRAEFPHVWPQIEKFKDGKSEYSTAALRKLLGRTADSDARHLVALGFLRESKGGSYTVPYLYRSGLNITQGKA